MSQPGRRICDVARRSSILIVRCGVSVRGETNTGEAGADAAVLVVVQALGPKGNER